MQSDSDKTAELVQHGFVIPDQVLDLFGSFADEFLATRDVRTQETAEVMRAFVEFAHKKLVDNPPESYGYRDRTKMIITLRSGHRYEIAAVYEPDPLRKPESRQTIGVKIAPGQRANIEDPDVADMMRSRARQ